MGFVRAVRSAARNRLTALGGQNDHVALPWAGCFQREIVAATDSRSIASSPWPADLSTSRNSCPGRRVMRRENLRYFTEKLRAIRLVLPCRSRIDTVICPFARPARGVASFSSQTPSPNDRKSLARFV